MSKSTSKQLRFPTISGISVRAAFDGGAMSSDFGALFLAGVDRQMGLTDRLAASFNDRRHPSYVSEAGHGALISESAKNLIGNARLQAWALLTRMILLIPLAACAVHTPYPLGIRGNPHVVIAVTPAAASAHVSRLSDIRSVSKSDTKNNEQAQIRETLKEVRLNVDACMRNWAGQREGIRMELGAHSMDEDNVELSWAKERGADLVLAVDVSGYGQVKRSWVLFMVGTGLIEGVAQGVATAGITGNPVIGAGVAAEEIAQESLTWLGGAWLWNKYLAPVTLEGRMWRVRDGRLIWHEVQFADSSNVFGLLFGKKQPKKEKALAMSLRKAEDDLFSDLGRYIDRQILHPGKGRL